LKTRHLGSVNPRLHTDEVLIALSFSAAESEEARQAIDVLQHLRGCDGHTPTILGSVDESIVRRLGMLVTSMPHYWVRFLFHRILRNAFISLTRLTTISSNKLHTDIVPTGRRQSSWSTPWHVYGVLSPPFGCDSTLGSWSPLELQWWV